MHLKKEITLLINRERKRKTQHIEQRKKNWFLKQKREEEINLRRKNKEKKKKLLCIRSITLIRFSWKYIKKTSIVNRKENDTGWNICPYFRDGVL